MPFYKANQKYNATLSTDYTAGDNTLTVSSTPSNVPTLVTVARGTSKETRFTVTGAGAGQLTGVARLDGASVNIPAGSSVECMNDDDFVNQLSSAIYTQEGTKNLFFGVDAGDSDAYEITLAVEPSELDDLLGVPITFRANTANEGACTLAVNGLAATNIKMSDGTTDPTTGEIPALGIATVIYNGTSFILQSVKAYVDSGTVTMTNKTLTTPVLASFYQDAEKKKLMTTPNTASDTLVTLNATQALTNKTISTIKLGDPVDATLDANGDVAFASSFMTLDTYGAAATDTLNHVTGGAQGDILIIREANSGRDITIKNNAGGPGEFWCGADKTFTNYLDTAIFIKLSTAWLMLSFSDNA